MSYVDGLIKVLESEDDPHEFRLGLLTALRLCFDELVESICHDQAALANYYEAFNAGLNGARIALSAYSRSGDIPYEAVRNEMRPFVDKIPALLRAGTRRLETRIREPPSESFFELVESELRDQNIGIDLIVAIASSGFEPALILADTLGVKDVFAIRYSPLRLHEYSIKIPAGVPESHLSSIFNGKNVLIVDDTVLTGGTMQRAINWVSRHSPAMVHFTAPAASLKMFGASDDYPGVLSMQPF